jgi:hypothetical protein
MAMVLMAVQMARSFLPCLVLTPFEAGPEGLGLKSSKGEIKSKGAHTKIKKPIRRTCPPPNFQALLGLCQNSPVSATDEVECLLIV